MRTLADLFERGTRAAQAVHLIGRGPGGVEESWSTAELREKVSHLSRTLAARGMRRGDRAALLSRNSPRWAATDWAMVTSSLVNVPLYPTLAPDQVRFILDDSGARGLFVEDRAQLERLGAALDGSALEWIVVLSDEVVPGVETHGWSAFVASGEGELEPDARPEPSDLASIIYTSGTTGRPKGVMLSHGNLVANLQQADDAVEMTMRGIDQVNLSLLPLCHIFQRLVDYLLFACGARMVYCQDPHEAMSWIARHRPTFFAAVPRIWEKVHAGMTTRIAQQPAWKRRLTAWALAAGKRRFHAWYRDGACDGRPGPWLALQHAIADALVLAKLRGAFGGRTDICFSGGGPLTRELHEFYRIIGLALLPGYGLTETSPVLCTNRRNLMKLGTVGPALPGVELRVAEDGELLARGPNVMQGYWKLPDETEKTIVDGWLLTGDLARIDERGFVSITGRKKEILVLTTGKKVVPALVEERMLRSELVSQAVLVGDERNFVAALVYPHPDRLEAAARAQGVPFASREELLASVQGRRIVAASIAVACADLSEFERPKTIALLPRELSVAEDELTPTLKVKRRVVAAKWSALIDSCFAGRGAGAGAGAGA
jgi:long-chain acyl-CoA synthetase